MFRNRSDAGRQLAARLRDLPPEHLVVLGLPRGGVPVAAEVARVLAAPLDVIIVRKVGVPFHSELAMGAIGEDGVRVVNEDVMRSVRVSEADFAAVETRERAELDRRARAFRGDRPRLDLTGRTALIVDDGIATGSTVRAACEVARAHGAARVIVAAPVAPPHAQTDLHGVADGVVVLETPATFYAIGQFYDDFRPTSDQEVATLLARARADAPRPHDQPALTARDDDVTIPLTRVSLGGRLTIPAGARGVVLFAHGSGSSRHSRRNQFVAQVLNRAGLGTLLFDLLTTAEAETRSNVFDIEFLQGRLAAATRWLKNTVTSNLPLGYFGASTGAAAALWASTDPDIKVAAVVSRGGRPDLAKPVLRAVRAPTLLIVGSRDALVLELNREAQAEMTCPTALRVVPGATHLFEEPGTLQIAAELARDWFLAHLTDGDRARRALSAS
jgi:predicted phosphoribosyltransferase/predicted alpha/beta-hydrolase family hydrolase